MELTLRKYREDTKKWQCYEVVENDGRISGNLFFPLEPQLPPMFNITIPVVHDPAQGVTA